MGKGPDPDSDVNDNHYIIIYADLMTTTFIHPYII